jgi:hypothetical protein
VTEDQRNEEHTEEEREEERTEEEPKQPEEPTGRFTQDDVDRIVSERLKREREKQDKDREKAEQKAREEALKEQGKFKEIAEQHERTIEEKDGQIEVLQGVETERDALQERLTTLEERLKGLIKPGLERVPEMFRGFVEEKPVEEQAAWLKKNADKLTGPAEPIGSPETPRPARNGRQRQEQDKEVAEAQRQRVSQRL